MTGTISGEGYEVGFAVKFDNNSYLGIRVAVDENAVRVFTRGSHESKTVLEQKI